METTARTQHTPGDIQSLRESIQRNGKAIDDALQARGIPAAPIASWLAKIDRIEATNAALLAALEALTWTARTFRNVPKDEQEWTTLDDEALEAAFAAIRELGVRS